jgi:hypothetical protein
MSPKRGEALPFSNRARRAPRGKGWIRGVCVAAIAASAVLLAAPVASAATWGFQDTAVPSGATTWGMNDVSCQASGDCMAVGSLTDSSFTSHVMTEQRVGSTWSVEPADELVGTLSSQFNGVSCPSAADCTAVGSYVTSSGQLPLAELWGGSGWSIDAFSAPSGAATSTLNGVDCWAASSCLAVGSWSASADGSGDTALAAVWNGSSWTLTSPVIPAGAVAAEFNGVSCPSATHCVAVGDYSTGNGALPLAEAWNGAAWTVQATPATAAAELGGVSCTSASACTAVGRGAMALRWNGTAWSQQKLARPHRGTVPDLSSVSCTSGGTCTGVGDYFVEGVANPAAEFWDGSGWKFQPVSITTSFDTAYLAGVSCRSLASCTSVGTYQDPVDGNRSFAEVIAVQWQVQPTPGPAGAVASSINDVSCPTASACLAVADWIGNKPGLHDFSEIWNGTSWSDGTVPSPATTDLRAVSCSAATACTAAGTDTADNGAEPTALRWNGTAWTVQSVPLPTGKTDGVLSDVSCPSATSCVAVGTASNAANQAETIAEIWNGTSWTVTGIPGPANSGVSAVSCSSATACIAVGSGSPDPLAASWNGTRWTSLTTAAAPPGSTFPLLDGVSCPSARQCLAVGYDHNAAGHQVILAEQWNGTHWKLRNPALPGTKASEFAHVSCTRAGACTAVGDATSHGQSSAGPLAELWNGSKWMLQVPALPAGATGGGLNGVSCRSLVSCIAVGSANEAHSTALAEQLS